MYIYISKFLHFEKKKEYVNAIQEKGVENRKAKKMAGKRS